MVIEFPKMGISWVGIGGVSCPEIKDLRVFELRDWWVLITEVNSDFYPTSHPFYLLLTENYGSEKG